MVTFLFDGYPLVCLHPLCRGRGEARSQESGREGRGEARRPFCTSHVRVVPAVPFCMHNPPGLSHKFRQLTHDPGLSDVAPTVLDLMGLDIPAEITGQSLLMKN